MTRTAHQRAAIPRAAAFGAKTLRAALLLPVLLAPSTPARPSESLPAPERTALRALCLATARQPPSPLAMEIAATALREHAAFGGHVIGRDGRLLVFGAVEADARRDPARGLEPAFRQVMRYWQTLGPVEGSPLGLRSGEDGTPNLPLATALERLGRADLSDTERQALQAAAERAAAVDVPWSAAFVSHVVLSAGVSRSRFAASMAHVDYVAEAARRSRAETGGTAHSALYRACDPLATPVRPGDLVCLHRHRPGEAPPAGRDGLFATLLPGLASGERPVWSLHCDIVVSRDERRRTAEVVGGNVLQSVSRRMLPVDRRGALARGPQRPDCFEDRGPGPLCRPESAAWFMLLQATGPD
ncbi:DUF2272 domain-containing protein [Phreatobacter sp.]|uniref:DUF2272 domain-containing protein n=1 Tax=Phreatobacter sp. TaxID=1966341 RepID=UPI003F7113CD